MENKNLTVEKIKESIDKLKFTTTCILLFNEEDLPNFNLEEMPKNVWLVPYSEIKKGTVSLISKDTLKRKIYDFCLQHPDFYYVGTGEPCV